MVGFPRPFDTNMSKFQIQISPNYTPENQQLEPKSPNWKWKSSEPNLHDLGGRRVEI